jgi:SAM-dependent methyltransferase
MTNNFLEAYYKHGSNLALFRSIGEMQDYWEEHWQGNFSSLLESARLGKLGEFEYPFTKYLPKDGPILEAGCGRGKYVCALQSLGYQIEGIDYAAKTIQQIRAIAPDLDVREGNIYAIDRPDNTYAAYISIGALEHDFAGPLAGLAEAYRVLCPGGLALISVPYLNWPRRRLWRNLPEALSEELSNGLRFYQDHLDEEHFAQEIQATGFTILEIFPYGLLGGFVRDWRLGRWLHRHHFYSYRLYQLIRKTCQHSPLWLRRDLSHMMMYICQK